MVLHWHCQSPKPITHWKWLPWRDQAENTDGAGFGQGLDRAELHTHKLGKADLGLYHYTFTCDPEMSTVMLWNPKALSQKGKKPQAPLRAHTCPELHRNFKFLSHSTPTSCILLLQTPRMAEVGRELWSSSCAIPLLKLFLQVLAKIVQADFQNCF